MFKGVTYFSESMISHNLMKNKSNDEGILNYNRPVTVSLVSRN